MGQHQDLSGADLHQPFRVGTHADRPASPSQGDWYYESDTFRLFRCDVAGTWIEQGVNADGWLVAGETWTYASASTFTVSGDVTAKYSKGTRLKFTQSGSVKYGVVISSVYSSPNTTVTILTNTDYTIASATISDNYISYSLNPQGYPAWFAVAVPTFSGIDDGASGQPTVSEHRARVDGNVYRAHFHIGNTAYKAGAANYFSWTGAVPVANTTCRSVIGSAYWNDASDKSYIGTVMCVSSTAFYSVIDSGDILADNTHMSHIAIKLEYEI